MIPGKCCFCLPLKTSVILIGLISMTVSFAGILLSTSSVLQYLTPPKDLLFRWLLQVCYFLDIHGIVFHSILFIVSTILEFGVVSDAPQLLLPWLGWCPFLITCILIQMIIVIVQEPDLSPPVVMFGMMILIFIIYASVVVAAYYRGVCLSGGTVRLRIFNIQQGELPRIVEVPRRLFGRVNRSGESPVIEPIATTSSSRPLQEASTSDPNHFYKSEMRRKLANAYSRFLSASRWTRQNQPLPSQMTTKF